MKQDELDTNSVGFDNEEVCKETATKDKVVSDMITKMGQCVAQPPPLDKDKTSGKNLLKNVGQDKFGQNSNKQKDDKEERIEFSNRFSLKLQTIMKKNNEPKTDATPSFRNAEETKKEDEFMVEDDKEQAIDEGLEKEISTYVHHTVNPSSHGNYKDNSKLATPTQQKEEEIKQSEPIVSEIKEEITLLPKEPEEKKEIIPEEIKKEEIKKVEEKKITEEDKKEEINVQNETKKEEDEKEAALLKRPQLIFNIHLQGTSDFDKEKKEKQMGIPIIDSKDLNELGDKIEDHVESPSETIVRNHFLMLQQKDKTPQAKREDDDEEQEEEEVEEEQKLLKEDGKEEGKALENKEDENKEEGKESEQESSNKKGKESKRKLSEDGVSNGSNTSNTMLRAHYGIRAAVEEKYTPSSIRKTDFLTIGLLLLLVLLAVLFYVFQTNLYSQVLKQINNISYSEARKSWLIDINIRLNTLLLINADNAESNESISVLDLSTIDKAALLVTTQSLLKTAGVNLQSAQTKLSLQTSQLDFANANNINSNNVILIYNSGSSSNVTNSTSTIWQGIIEIVVSSFRIANMSINDINNNDSSVCFINTNSDNSIFLAINESTNSIINQIQDDNNSVTTIFLILLLIASGGILISSVLLIPVLNSSRNNKEKVLLLLLELGREDVQEYKEKCERFIKFNKLVFSVCYIIFQ